MKENEIEILLFRGRGMVSRLIRWQTRSRYSHAAMTMARNPDGSADIIEAWQGAGVRRKRLTDWSGVDAFRVQMPDAEAAAAARNFMGFQVGKKYDYLSVLRFVTRRRPTRDIRWFCSELVFCAVGSAGVGLLNVEASRVSPGMLAWSPAMRMVAVGGQ